MACLAEGTNGCHCVFNRKQSSELRYGVARREDRRQFALPLLVEGYSKRLSIKVVPVHGAASCIC
jgi:hypothetical protein